MSTKKSIIFEQSFFSHFRCAHFFSFFCIMYTYIDAERHNPYKKPMVRYDSDIMAMQEVEPIVFTRDLEPYLKQRGYAGIYEQKTGNSQLLDGCATFYKAAKFDLVLKKGEREERERERER